MNFDDWFDYYLDLEYKLARQRQEELALKKVFVDQNQLLMAINTREVKRLSGQTFRDFCFDI